MPTNRVIAITGASAGIGRATALRLARDGAAVAICARRGDRLNAVAAEIVAAGGQALPIVSLASYGAIVGCVSAGAGVALVPKGVFDQYAIGVGCAGYEFPELTAVENLFYWHENVGVHPAREAFVGMSREEFA